MSEALTAEADWTIAEAAARQQSLLLALESQFEDLAIDASGIESIDSAGLQLLLALRASLRQRNLGLQLLRPRQWFELHAELGARSKADDSRVYVPATNRGSRTLGDRRQSQALEMRPPRHR